MKTEGWSVRIASDIVRDGLGMELLSREGTVSAEIFRCDGDHTLSRTIWATQIPTDVLVWFRTAARRELGDTYEDGTPVDWREVP